MKTQVSYTTPVKGLLEALRAGNAVSDSEQYLTGLEALRIDHQHELEQQVLNLQNQIKNLQRNVKEVTEHNEDLRLANLDLRKDKEYLKDQLEDKLQLIEAHTGFIKQVFTTPEPKVKKEAKIVNVKEEKSKQEKMQGHIAYMLSKRK